MYYQWLVEIEVCRYCYETAASHQVVHMTDAGRPEVYHVACKQYVLAIMMERERRKMPVYQPAIETGDDYAELPTAWELGQAKKLRAQQAMAGCGAQTIGTPDAIINGKPVDFKTVPEIMDRQLKAYQNYSRLEPDFGPLDELLEKASED